MIDAVRRNDVIFQCGTQERHRSDPRRLAALARTGALGEIKKVITVVGPHNVTGPGPGWKPMPVPEGFDYPMWLGPAPMVPYHEARCIYKFRFGLDYSGGQITNFGAHAIDVAQWGNGTSLTGPVEVEGLHAEWPPEGSLFNTALTTGFRARYANGAELRGESSAARAGTRFEGTEGWVAFSYRGMQASSRALETTVIGPDEIHLPVSNPARTVADPGDYTADHIRNFLDSVKTRQEPIEPVEVGHRTASVCHLWNIAIQRIGKTLEWNPEKERFTNDEAANSMLSRPVRDWA